MDKLLHKMFSKRNEETKQTSTKTIRDKRDLPQLEPLKSQSAGYLLQPKKEDKDQPILKESFESLQA